MRCQFCGAALEALTAACPFCAAQPVLGDRYGVRALIGRGGMGEVFLGYDRRLANDVAIKRLPPQFSSSPELRDSLEKEARILARLSDSAIVRLFDLAEFHGDLYLILEYVCGPSLREILNNGYKTPLLELAALMGDICRGLSVAHKARVIHRDLKPSNLLLSLDGADRMAFASSRRLPPNLAHAKVKIADFGIAKAIADSGSTLTNAFSGTPGYMAPEQFRGEAPGPETDVYALGVVTRELCDLRNAHPAVSQVVAKATANARASRFPTAEAFYDALCRAIEGHSPSRPALKPARPTNTQRVAGAVSLIAFALAIAVVASVISTDKGPRHRQTIEPMFQEDAIAIEWHSAPPVKGLPPVVEEARGRLPRNGLAGPANPKILWKVALNTEGVRIGAIGTDGTVYVTSIDGLCAIRNGKVKWAYKTGIGGSTIKIAPDGRIWYHSIEDNYCLNRDGVGGRLPPSIPRPDLDEPSGRVDCLMNHTLSGPHWKIDLDGECTAGPVIAPEGRVYVATDSPQILAVSSGGSLAWKYHAPCNALSLVPTQANHVVFACDDGALYGLTNGTQAWEHSADGRFNPDMLADSSGTLYYGDYGRETGTSHLHAVDAQGKSRWNIDLQRATVTNLALNNQRQLCAAASFLHARIFCVGD